VNHRELSSEHLRRIRLFEPLGDDELQQIARLFHYARYRLNETIFEQGDPGKAFYILETGILRVRRMDARGQEHVIDYYRAPYAFGETSLLTGIPHDATVDVFSDVAELFILPKGEWDTFLAQHADIQKKLNVRPDVRKKLTMPRFPWLGEGEYVIVYTRRHWFALFLMLRFPLLVAMGLTVLAGLLTLISATVSNFAFLAIALWIVTLVWIVLAGVWTIVDWSNDYLIVTNRRVVHYERVWGLREERAEAPIEQVSNVIETSLGLAARLFNYADVRIETAGHQVDIYFPFVLRRWQVRQNVFSELEHVRERAQREKREQLRSEIRSRLLEYIAPPKITTAAPSITLPTSTLAPLPVRQRRQSRLGRRLNLMFGIQIEEKGRITWRKHWFDLLGRAGKWFGLTLLTALVGPLVFFATGGLSFDLARLAFIAIWVIVLAILSGFTWWHYEDWRNDIYELTDESVLDIERSPFRLKERSVATTLDRIQNVSYSKPGLINNLFDYGDLIIETAGGEGQLVFRKVPNPQWATQEIFRRREAQRERRQQQQVRQRVDDFLDWVLVYHQILQQQGDVRVLPAQPPPPPATPPPAEEPAAPPTE